MYSLHYNSTLQIGFKNITHAHFSIIATDSSQFFTVQLLVTMLPVEPHYYFACDTPQPYPMVNDLFLIASISCTPDEEHAGFSIKDKLGHVSFTLTCMQHGVIFIH